LSIAHLANAAAEQQVIFKGRGLAKFLRHSNEAAVNSSAEVYPYVNPPPLFFNKNKAPANISFFKTKEIRVLLISIVCFLYVFE
jgi:hypothetical protein